MDGRICIKIPGLTGSCYERKAADYLKQQGLFILRYNYRCRFGEIDLIARDGEYLVFVAQGTPEEVAQSPVSYTGNM